MDKAAIITALLAHLTDDIARATDSANRTRQGAVHEEARPENDKDTRALEASYLARGQAKRVVELEEDRKRVTFMELRTFGPEIGIGVSALVLLEDEDDGSKRWVLIAVAGGGRRIDLAGASIDVITPEAPLGRALAGRVLGEDFQVRMGARERELRIVDVR